MSWVRYGNERICPVRPSDALTREAATGAEEWEQVLSRSFVPLSADRLSPSFRGRVSPTTFGITKVCDVSAGAQRVIRSRRLVADASHDDLLLSLHLSGAGALTQDGRQAVFTPGGAAVYDTSRPYVLSFPGETRQIVVQVPWRDLGVDHARIEAAAARPLPMTLPAVRMLHALATEAVQSAGAQASRLGEPVGRSLAELAAALILECTEQEPFGSPDVRMGLLASIKVDIRHRIADPTLDVSTLARRHHVSVRYVHALFADVAESPASFVRRERLRLAYDLLGHDPKGRHTVAGIARQVGFCDPTTFTRAFRAEFGCTPTEHRATHTGASHEA